MTNPTDRSTPLRRSPTSVTALWMTMWVVPAWVELQQRWQRLRREPEAGYSTETVVVTALLVVLAIIVIGIIAVAVTAKANSITL